MGAKVSAEMLKARELILKGINPAEAARRCGLTRSAIYHSTWYKKWRLDNPVAIDTFVSIEPFIHELADDACPLCTKPQ